MSFIIHVESKVFFVKRVNCQAFAWAIAHNITLSTISDCTFQPDNQRED